MRNRLLSRNKGLAGKNIEQGTVLSVNVVTGKGPMHKVFRENGVNGRIGMDMTPEFSARLGLRSYRHCLAMLKSRPAAMGMRPLV